MTEKEISPTFPDWRMSVSAFNGQAVVRVYSVDAADVARVLCPHFLTKL